MYLSIQEAAEKLKIGKTTLYQLVYNGEIPAYKIANKWRFDEDELDDWVKSHGVQKSDKEEVK